MNTTSVAHNISADPDLGRRRALGLLVGACGSAFALPDASLAQAPEHEPGNAQGAGGPPPGDFRASEFSATLTQITPNVHAFLQLPRSGQIGRSLANCGLVVGPKHMLAIDSTAAPVQARNFIASAQRAGGKPFRRVALTHHHFDHTFGLQFFGEVDVIAHEQCRKRIMENPQTESAVKSLWSKRGGWADGTEQFRKIVPNITYEDRMTLHDYGDTEVQLLHFDRGHTVGDTLAYLPKEKILFAGDVAFFNMTPLDGSGYIADWIKVCDTILGMEVDTIVPGHGPLGGKQELADMRDYLTLIYIQGRKLFDSGVPAQQAGKMIELGRFAAWPESDRTNVNIMRLYSEFDGTIKP